MKTSSERPSSCPIIGDADGFRSPRGRADGTSILDPGLRRGDDAAMNSLSVIPAKAGIQRGRL
jgi:hypothetical protein